MGLKHTPVKLAIIGGGAAGMFAAAAAADRKISCVLIERKARLGSKVLMTANGRCNFAKDISAEQFLKDLEHSDTNGELKRQSRFISSAIRETPPRKIISFFKSLNVPVRRHSDARMFPADGKATTIVHAFGDLFRNCEIPILTNCPVTGIQPQKNGFIVATHNFTLWAENVLIATGGVSYPKLGSVGDGQKFASLLGHKLVPYRPGLIGLTTNDPSIVKRAPRRYENGRARLYSEEGRLIYDYKGEIDFETFGLSGAAIYNSQRVIEHSGLKKYSLEIQFDRERLTFTNLQPRPVKEAIVTIGGIDTDTINPETMESKFVRGLYFAGEVMDIDGPTGGYNLTMAFATAAKAVASIV